MAMTFSRYLLAGIMVVMGVLHFVVPRPFVQVVPSYLPNPSLLVAVSGFFEVVGGVGLLVPATRFYAGVGLILLYFAVFPANVNMALHPELFPRVPVWTLWVRLPLQIGLIWWAWTVGSSRGS